MCDKYPQKQGLVLSDFIHIKSQAAIGEARRQERAGRRRRRYRRTAPTSAVSITSADVTRQRLLEAVYSTIATLSQKETKEGEKMGHTAIPILMAVLSFCVWENVEVRRHNLDHLQRWRIAILLHVKLNVDVTRGQKCCILLHADISHATHTAASASYLHIADAHSYLGQV